MQHYHLHDPDARDQFIISGGEGPVSGSAGSGSSQLSSMAESVTRHAQNPPADNFQFLLCGIDTLDLGLYVSWNKDWKKVRTSLDQMKAAAQGTTGILDESDIGRKLLHLPSGKPPNYRYHLQFPEYHIYIAISECYQNSPNVYVTILAETFWHVGLSTILELLEFDLDHFGGTIDRIQPSRCDLCVDFKLSPPLTLEFIEAHRVSRSRKTRCIMNNKLLETFYSGSPNAAVQGRIYDKWKEIQQSNKQYFLNLWGTDDPQGVWRVEFQLRRPFLKQYKVQTLDDLFRTVGSMWHHLTGEWFSLRHPDTDKSERRSIHPWWEAVRQCGERFGDNLGIKRTFTSDTVEPIQHTLSHIVGRLITIAAQSGIRDRKEAIEHLSKLLDSRTDDEKFRSEYEKKSIRLGYRGKLGGANDEEA